MVGMAKDEDWQYAMLWLVTYVFLLRLPSEVGVALLVNTLWRTHQRLPGLADWQNEPLLTTSSCRADGNLA